MVFAPQSVPVGTIGVAEKSTVSMRTSSVAPVVTVLVAHPTLDMLPVLGAWTMKAAPSSAASNVKTELVRLGVPVNPNGCRGQVNGCLIV